MKQNGYIILCELFSKRPDEHVIKSYPFVSVEVYKGSTLETKRKLLARFTITDKKFIVDRLSSFIVFPILKPSRGSRKLSMLDIQYFTNKVKEVEIPLEYIKKVIYNEEKDALMIDTLLDGYLIYIKTRDSQKFSDEVIDILSKIIKKYKNLRTIDVSRIS